MLETSLVAGTSINVKNEIQAINIISTIVAEQQVEKEFTALRICLVLKTFSSKSISR